MSYSEDKKNELRKLVFNTVEDLVVDFLYYNRKGDEDLPVGRIEKLIKQGVITEQEIIDRFGNTLKGK